MITKYFTKVVVKFNPLGKEGKSARLFLSSIPPSQRNACSIDHEVLSSQSKNSPIVKVTFKDKHILEADPTVSNFTELTAIFDRYSRQLQIKEAIES